MPATSTNDLSNFFREGQEFLRQLKRNNNKDWFEKNRAQYQETVQLPSKRFAAQLNEALGSKSGYSLQSKIFRINRDMRFATEKTPYKTQVHMTFAASLVGGKPAGPAFFFGLEPNRVIFGAGCFVLEKSLLDAYRRAVADNESGSQLSKILNRLRKSDVSWSEPELKRVPSGFDPEHSREQLLRRKSLAVWRHFESIGDLHHDNPIRACNHQFKSLLPLVNWMVEHVAH